MYFPPNKLLLRIRENERGRGKGSLLTDHGFGGFEAQDILGGIGDGFDEPGEEILEEALLLQRGQVDAFVEELVDGGEKGEPQVRVDYCRL